jgi:hypothetical protein
MYLARIPTSGPESGGFVQGCLVNLRLQVLSSPTSRLKPIKLQDQSEVNQVNLASTI